MLNGQYIPYVLPSQTYTAGNRTTQTLRDLPKQYLGKLCHLMKFCFSVILTPTFSTAPSIVGNNNIMAACDWYDGSILRFQGGFNHLRAKERLQTGHIRVPDANTAATTGQSRYFRRTLHAGPPQFLGSPVDFVLPTGCLENGELRFTHGALTDISADTTAATGTIRIVAWLLLSDEIKIPPAYTFTNQTVNAADFNLTGRALYESVALLNSTSFDAFTSANIAQLRLDLGQGDIVPSVQAADLTHAFLDDFAAGEIGVPQGDTEAALDNSAARINRGASPATALTSSDKDLQVVLWSGPDSRITKLQLAESVARLRWSGAQTSAVAVLGRILSQPSNVIAAMAGKAVGRLNLTPKNMRIKTLKGGQWKSDKGEFMPWKLSV